MLHRLDDAAPGGEFHREVVDVEQRLRSHFLALCWSMTLSENRFPLFRVMFYVLRWGSTMSRRPSPSRLKQNTAIIKARPGNSAIHHSPDTMKPAPSATMMPHSAVGGRTPSPMNERPAALRMA